MLNIQLNQNYIHPNFANAIERDKKVFISLKHPPKAGVWLRNDETKRICGYNIKNYVCDMPQTFAVHCVNNLLSPKFKERRFHIVKYEIKCKKLSNFIKF